MRATPDMLAHGGRERGCVVLFMSGYLLIVKGNRVTIDRGITQY